MANRGFVTIQLRKDSATNWTSVNPILVKGEPGFETDTGKLKIGDGVTSWSGLSYLSGSSGSGVTLEQVEDDLGTSFIVAGTGLIINYNDSANTLTLSNSGINVLSPTAISTSQNNYDPGAGDVLRVSASASGVNITGLVPRLEKLRLLINIGSSNNLTLKHESASSTAANRFTTPNGGDYIVQPTGSTSLFYDDTNSRWRIL
jgi:hypothetical protein